MSHDFPPIRTREPFSDFASVDTDGDQFDDTFESVEQATSLIVDDHRPEHEVVADPFEGAIVKYGDASWRWTHGQAVPLSGKTVEEAGVSIRGNTADELSLWPEVRDRSLNISTPEARIGMTQFVVTDAQGNPQVRRWSHAFPADDTFSDQATYAISDKPVDSQSVSKADDIYALRAISHDHPAPTIDPLDATANRFLRWFSSLLN